MNKPRPASARPVRDQPGLDANTRSRQQLAVADAGPKGSSHSNADSLERKSMRMVGTRLPKAALLAVAAFVFLAGETVNVHSQAVASPTRKEVGGSTGPATGTPRPTRAPIIATPPTPSHTTTRAPASPRGRPTPVPTAQLATSPLPTIAAPRETAASPVPPTPASASATFAQQPLAGPPTVSGTQNGSFASNWPLVQSVGVGVALAMVVIFAAALFRAAR
jgi:hypothetical protein